MTTYTITLKVECDDADENALKTFLDDLDMKPGQDGEGYRVSSMTTWPNAESAVGL
jgi:hypothetical protein